MDTVVLGKIVRPHIYGLITTVITFQENTAEIFQSAADHSLQVLDLMRPPAPKQGDLALDKLCADCFLSALFNARNEMIVHIKENEPLIRLLACGVGEMVCICFPVLSLLSLGKQA